MVLDCGRDLSQEDPEAGLRLPGYIGADVSS